MELSSTNVSVSHLDEKPEFCRLAPEKGPCVGRWTRYFYNESRDDCSVFLYGGCDGNENNFHSILACRVICQKPPEDPISRLIESPQHAEEKVKCIGHTKIEHLCQSLDFPNFLYLEKNGSLYYFLLLLQTNLSLNFDDGFEDWQVEKWSIWHFNSSSRASSASARSMDFEPFNGSSKAAGTPLAHFTSALK